MNFLDALRNSGKVIKEGLITPNKFNKPAADRFKSSALPMLGVPGAVAETADELYKGNPGMAALAATGIVPGIGALGTFIGKGAKNGMWDVFAAEEAARLLRKGIDPHMTTGVHQGADDILRQEIPDNLATFHPGALENLQNVDDMPVGQLINHPELFKAYPEIADMSVASLRGSNSMYHPEWDSIGLGRDSLDPMSSMLHEIQHKIQQTEGWAKGGAPTSFKDIPGGPDATEQYKRLAGEVEARNTQRRLGMNVMDRRRDHPYTTMDREIPDQAVWGVGEQSTGPVQKEMVDLYHGGSYEPGQPIKGKLYAAPDKRMADTYVDMAASRFGGNPRTVKLQADLLRQAPDIEIDELAKQFGIDNGYYTPASVFDDNLHDPVAVEKLIRTLRARGYDHAKLQDRPYGYGTGGAPEMDETAYTLFPGVKTK